VVALASRALAFGYAEQAASLSKAADWWMCSREEPVSPLRIFNLFTRENEVKRRECFGRNEFFGGLKPGLRVDARLDEPVPGQRNPIGA
jgi:hypothetical protein